MAVRAPSKPQSSRPADSAGFDSLAALGTAWAQSLRAANKAPKTVRVYGDALATFASFIGEKGMPERVPNIRREHVEMFIVDRLATKKPTTVSIEYRALQQFFKWAVEEDEIDESPMAKMKAPRIPETPPPVYSDDDLRALIDACTGRDYAARRDMAIVRLLIDTGMRRGELAGLMVEDVDFERGRVEIRAETSKTRTGRSVPIGYAAGRALAKYLRARASHRDADAPAIDDRGRPVIDERTRKPLHPLWLGLAGPMTVSGVAQAIKERGKLAGLGANVRPHLFRHTAAHRWQLDGGNETDLMTVMGWRSSAMLRRYGAGAREERAAETHRRLGLGDRLK